MNTRQHNPATASSLKIRVNRSLCQGHGRCVALAPELFDADAFGDANEIGDGTVLPDLEDKAWLTKANCPERAIDVEPL